MCGILGGNGVSSGGLYKGIATKCRFVVGKILNQKGEGNLENLIEAVAWVLSEQKRYRIRILNISIGIEHALDTEKNLLVISMLKEVWKRGIVVVVSAGNTGPAFMTISAIGDAAEIITVGCNDRDYISQTGKLCESYSSRGPGRDAIKKPDLVAPGTDIMSCSEQCRLIFGRYKNAYCRKSGTSMASPIVAGAAALILEKRPELSNGEVKRILLQSADNLGLPWHVQGHGFLNIAKAIAML